MVQKGDKLNLENLNLINQDGEKILLSDEKYKYLVLYFYPKDMTPGCTIQACQIKDNYDFLKSKGILVLGVSKDSQKSHKRFRDTFKLNFDLIIDEDASLSEYFGVVKEKSMFGRKYKGINRTTFIIDLSSGEVRDRWDNVDPNKHIDQIKQYFNL
ncbi:MAG: peroxiredoxin [Candidatus Dojkabacteria bacterium]|nr:peroxiredoxin [Candidatus Dojkabacteria bacterium]